MLLLLDGPPPSSAEDAASSSNQMDVLLPPGRETHNHRDPFMTILVGDTPELLNPQVTVHAIKRTFTEVTGGPKYLQLRWR